MWDIKVLAYDLFCCKSIQDYINRRFSSKDKVVVDMDALDSVITKDGSTFKPARDIATIFQVIEDYHFGDIKESDIVVDIGANIGGFCIPASKLSSRVWALEPITTKELEYN